MKAFLETFFSGLGIEIQSLEVKEEADDLSIRIETPDSPLLIGVHGKNREAFQHLIGRIAEKKLWHFVHVHLEVNDYMKAKDERLFTFLEWKIGWVMQSGKSTQISNLSSFERKKAHNYIAEKKIEWLGTKSEWEWEARILVLTYTGVLKTAEKPIDKPSPSEKKEKSTDISLLSEDGVGI
jgi:predicted RNA-binding protein Jag